MCAFAIHMNPQTPEETQVLSEMSIIAAEHRSTDSFALLNRHGISSVPSQHSWRVSIYRSGLQVIIGPVRLLHVLLRDLRTSQVSLDEIPFLPLLKRLF